MEKEPTLEEYGLNISSYENYKNEKNELDKNLKPYDSSTWQYSLFIVLLFSALIFQSAILVVIGFIILIATSVSDNFKDKEREKIVLEYRKQIEYIKNKVFPFEESCEKYYLNFLEQYYQENIYKKRSGNEKIEKSISEFSSMIDEVEEINKKLIFKNIDEKLFKYKVYLIGKKLDHQYQINKKFNTFNDLKINNKIQKKENSIDISKIISNKENEEINNKPKNEEKPFIKSIPPEKRYVTPRKIDNWEEINKKRKETGDKGEEIVMAIEREFLESVNRKDLADKIKHVSLEIGDGLGYDILSFSENGKEKYIEVKSTTVSIDLPFNLSSNELRFLQDNRETAFIYRILITNDIPEFVAFPSYEVLGGQITPVSFIVKINI